MRHWRSGMGRLREVCGAISSMFMVAGMLYGYSDPNDHQAKTSHYELIQRLASKFKVANGSIICRELLDLQESPGSPEPEKRSDAYYGGRPCSGLVEFAAKLTAELLEERGICDPAYSGGLGQTETTFTGSVHVTL
jgi:C_GCAxxG_C_C family probable redox protein